ncbi:MAG: DUF2283 domain-containing protein [Candidatus Poribacteria bacterium]|nr:DUF2283 domain-containing protein [Candidatus Poribacteria bacterium]
MAIAASELDMQSHVRWAVDRLADWFSKKGHFRKGWIDSKTGGIRRAGDPSYDWHFLYDKPVDVLYLRFGEVKESDDADHTEDDIILHFNGDSLIGATVLNLSKRMA